MFLESDFYYVFGPALLLVIIIANGYRFWMGKKENELERAISGLLINIVSIGFLCIVLWLMLPPTPTLSTFDYPQAINELQSNEQLLGFLQDQNRAILRTTQVVQWFIFLFVWGLLTALYSAIKAFNSQRGVDNSGDLQE